MTVMDEDGQVASSLQFKPEDEQREKEVWWPSFVKVVKVEVMGRNGRDLLFSRLFPLMQVTEYHNKQMQQMRARVDEANEVCIALFSYSLAAFLCFFFRELNLVLAEATRETTAAREGGWEAGAVKGWNCFLARSLFAFRNYS